MWILIAYVIAQVVADVVAYAVAQVFADAVAYRVAYAVSDNFVYAQKWYVRISDCYLRFIEETTDNNHYDDDNKDNKLIPKREPFHTNGGNIQKLELGESQMQRVNRKIVIYSCP